MQIIECACLVVEHVFPGPGHVFPSGPVHGSTGQSVVARLVQCNPPPSRLLSAEAVALNTRRAQRIDILDVD